MFGIGNLEMVQNKPLRNCLLGSGLLLVITAIVLNSIAAHSSLTMLCQVCMWIGIPILMMGIMMTIVQKYSNRGEEPQNATNEASCWKRFINRFSRGNRVGHIENNHLNQQEIRELRLQALGSKN